MKDAALLNTIRDRLINKKIGNLAGKITSEFFKTVADIVTENNLPATDNSFSLVANMLLNNQCDCTKILMDMANQAEKAAAILEPDNKVVVKE